jgi:AAA domain
MRAEDDEGDTIVPRLMAAGADLDKVVFLRSVTTESRKEGLQRRMFNFQVDLESLRKTILDMGDVKLVIIDPVSAYMGVGKVDTYRTSDVRAVLGPVKEMAEQLKIAIVCIMHFNKKTDVTNALLRISDSLAYGAAARHVYGAIDDRENDRKLLVKAKNNLTSRAAGGTLAYRFNSKEVGSDHETGEAIFAPLHRIRRGVCGRVGDGGDARGGGMQVSRRGRTRQAAAARHAGRRPAAQERDRGNGESGKYRARDAEQGERKVAHQAEKGRRSLGVGAIRKLRQRASAAGRRHIVERRWRDHANRILQRRGHVEHLPERVR